MHPLMNVYLAKAMQDDRLRRVKDRRRALERAGRRHAPLPRLRAPWPVGWSARQPTLRSD
jgi:hypothetical protein